MLLFVGGLFFFFPLFFRGRDGKGVFSSRIPVGTRSSCLLPTMGP